MRQHGARAARRRALVESVLAPVEFKTTFASDAYRSAALALVYQTGMRENAAEMLGFSPWYDGSIPSSRIKKTVFEWP